MLRRRSIVLGLALIALAATYAGAQPAPPWTGIAANEARPTLLEWSSGDNEGGAMSADGRFVVFDSRLTNLVHGDYNNWNDVFLRDRQTGELRRVSVATNGLQGDSDSAFAKISNNGRHIAFWSCATNFDPADTNGRCDLFIHDREAATTVLANLGPDGEQATSTTQHYFRLSSDGRYFVFLASFGGEYNDQKVYLRDRDTDQNGVFDEAGGASTTLISQDWVGNNETYGFQDVAISDDGRWIAYAASANRLDEFSYESIGTRMYLHDRVAQTTSRVDRPMANGTDTVAYASGPNFSDNGLLAYSSNADNLAEGDTDGFDDIYVFNVFTGGNVPIELSHPGAPTLEYEWGALLSADGRYVAFTGVNYGEWWQQVSNVFVVDRQTGLSYAISVRPDGLLDNEAWAAAISADGSQISFSGSPNMLPNNWGPTGIYVAGGVALSPAEINVHPDGGTFDIDVTVPAGVAWQLHTFEPSLEFSQSSGVGPSTVQVTVHANTFGEEREYYVVLGSEQIVLHQAVRPELWGTYPYEGPLAGGTEVEVWGEGFVDGATVTFNGVPATNVVVVDSALITAVTPANFGVEWVDVTVTNPGGASATFFYGFRYFDETPPTITPVITGTLGANGWYTSDVTVNWTVEDLESEIRSEPCLPFTQTSDVVSALAWCHAFTDYGETSSQVEIKRDTVPPTAFIAVPYEPEYSFGEEVPLVIHCGDETSSIASCTTNPPGPNLDTTSFLGTHTLTLTALDTAGHSVSTSVEYSIRYGSTMEVAPAAGVYGEPTTLYASLTFDYGTGTGGAGMATVTFFVNDAPVGTAVTAQSGIAALPIGGLSAGTYTVRAEFAGHGSLRPASGSGIVTIAKATPAITWPQPAQMIQGTPLSATQLNATATAAGTFAYSPAAGTVPGLGVTVLNVSFTPHDTQNYNSATAWTFVWVKAVPVITWFSKTIHYPQTLPAYALDATVNASGWLEYSHTVGTAFDVGTHTLTVTFTPANPDHYTTATRTMQLSVLRGFPTVTFPASASIPYGTALSSAQLNATASVPGSFAYSPGAGTVLPAGFYTLSVVFTPTDSTHWETVTRQKGLAVSQLIPTVDWNPPASMPWGTPLGAAQLNATSSLPGTYSYVPQPGTVLAVGNRELTVLFNPDDPNYSSKTFYRSVTVTLAPTTITWNDPAAIVYGTPITQTQLNATANVAGTFSYQPALGPVLPAGSHTLTTTFTPTDTAHYAGSSKQVTLVVAKRTPSITWTAPTPIVYGTALSPSQLNATANVPGTFEYLSALGTVLPAGTQTLSVTFTPSDPANNLPASASATITVAAATPSLTWSNPSNIVYGAALSATQLNATGSTAGTFEYSPASGTVLAAGTHSLSVTFTPADSSNYLAATTNVSIVVAKAAPTVSWSNPSSIGYGTALSGSQLNASASVPGTFEYSPAAGTVLNVGTRQLSVAFTPDDAANYAAASMNVSIVITQAAPIVTWVDPAGLTYGNNLTTTQLNATADVPGTFVYSPPHSTVLNAGTHQLSVTFTPTDAANYAAATANVTLIVARATPPVSFSTSSAITYGTALAAAQLNASAFGMPGTFTFTPPAGTVLNAGTHELSVTFNPTDSVNQNTVVKTASLVVLKATPVVSWPAPAGINYGTPLSATQLNATASLPGTFVYSPAAGTVLNAGIKPLSVTFTPADTVNYNTSSEPRTITVAQVALTVQTVNASKVYGQALPAFTASGTGFVNGDSIASLTGSMTFSTAATATSAPGTYAVTPSGVSSTNYTISFANGTLTVSKASTSVAMTTTPNPSANNQVVQLRAVVSAMAPGAGTPTGTVEFRQGTTLLGTATLVNGVATMNKSFKRGSHALTATYVASTNFNSSVGSVTHSVP